MNREEDVMQTDDSDIGLKKRRTGLLGFVLWCVLGAAGGGVGLFVIGNWVVMDVLTWRSESRVPDLYELDVAVAKKTLLDRGLVFINDSTDFVSDNTVPANHVVSQDPFPYSRVKSGRRVRVAISRGPRHYPVPNVISTEPKEAYLRLVQHGFRMGELRFQLDPTPGRSDMFVISQSPPPTTARAQHDSVDIVVRVRAVMPDLSARALHEVRQVIRMLGLRIGSVTYSGSSELLPYSVMEQSIPPGATIRRGDRVNLVLSML